MVAAIFKRLIATIVGILAFSIFALADANTIKLGVDALLELPWIEIWEGKYKLDGKCHVVDNGKNAHHDFGENKSKSGDIIDDLTGDVDIYLRMEDEWVSPQIHLEFSASEQIQIVIASNTGFFGDGFSSGSLFSQIRLNRLNQNDWRGAFILNQFQKDSIVVFLFPIKCLMNKPLE